MITTTRTTRRATKTKTEQPGRGTPPRALADGVLERRRTSRRHNEPSIARPDTPTAPARGELLPALLSPVEHYRMEIARRSERGGGTVGDVGSLLAEAKAEYEAMLAAPRPAGKGGRPKKKPAPAADEIELADEDALGEL